MAPLRLTWHWLAGLIVAARLATLPLSGYSQEYGFIEAYYSLLAKSLPATLQPEWWGVPITNTPPLYVWFLAAWGRLVGWEDYLLRIPSVVAWASVAYPVYRLGGKGSALAWLSFPLGFIVAGKTQPDMTLTALMTWAYYWACGRRQAPFLLTLMAGVLVKPHAAIASLGALGWRWGLTAATGLGISLAWALHKTGFSGMLLTHFTARGAGHWGLGYWIIACVGFGSLTALPSLWLARREDFRLWGVVGLLTLFTLYAMPPYAPHEYYWLPALPFLATLLRRVPSRVVPVVVGLNLAMAGYGSWTNGDLWDDRAKDLAAEWELDGADTGLGTLAGWYEGRQVNHLGNGTILAREPLVGCTVLAESQSPHRGDHSLYVLTCA